MSLSGPVVYETDYGLYVYTPIVLLFFYPYVLLFDFSTALLVQRLLGVAVALGYGAILAKFLRSKVELEGLDMALITGFVGLSLYPIVITVLGGIEIFLGAALGVGWILLEKHKDERGGALWALASLFKIFPALWGLFLLRTRNTRAIIAAVVTGVGATLAGVLLFGFDAYVRYFETTTGSRVRVRSLFAGGSSPDNEAVTLIRPLAQLFPTVDPVTWIPVIFVVVAALLGFIYLRLSDETLTERATLLLATVIAITFVMPTSQDLDMYLVYGPLVVLLYIERRRLEHLFYSIGAVILVYNFNRNELIPVVEFLGLARTGILDIAIPVLAFASLPLYGLTLMFAGCFLRAIRSDADASLYGS
ncbi:glycosyltransferase family 87 protein [Halobellus captivus]|uniref:glycosyltransferase family 87 protein n=1 Tax=Halobellus captivus TaxID=2592614 RepID=UPI001396BD6C|nr:glycosyltransferase family 87 protein [Halobellus captivus]